MTIALNPAHISGSRVVQRVAIAAGGAAIAAVAFSGVASAFPVTVINNTSSIGATSNTTKLSFNVPSPGDPHLGFSASNSTTRGTTTIGGGAAFDVNVLHPVTQNTAAVTGFGINLPHYAIAQVGIHNSQVIHPIFQHG